MANDVAFSSTVAGLQGRPISTATPSTDQVLTWDGSQWSPETPATSLPPDGGAGGDLTGTYPNPEVGSIQGVAISGTPADGYVLQATSSTAASWQALPAPSYGGLVCNSNTNVSLITNNTPYVCNFDSAASISNSGVVATTGTNAKLTINVSGIYYVSITLNYSVNGNDTMAFNMTQNGNHNFNIQGYQVVVSGVISGFTAQGIISCTAGDYLQFVAYNVSENGKTLTMQDAGTSFSVFKIA